MTYSRQTISFELITHDHNYDMTLYYTNTHLPTEGLSFTQSGAVDLLSGCSDILSGDPSSLTLSLFSVCIGDLITCSHCSLTTSSIISVLIFCLDLFLLSQQFNMFCWISKILYVDDLYQIAQPHKFKDTFLHAQDSTVVAASLLLRWPLVRCPPLLMAKHAHYCVRVFQEKRNLF